MFCHPPRTRPVSYLRTKAKRYRINLFCDVVFGSVYTCISMTKSLIWSCEKMIYAYVSIWRCLMDDIIIEIREKVCGHVHHLEISTQEWKWKQLSAIIQIIYER